MKRWVVFALAVSFLACTHSKPSAPEPVQERISLVIKSDPEGAVVFREGKELGNAPMVVTLNDWTEALGFSAKIGEDEPVEVRVRMLGQLQGELYFRFSEAAKQFAQRLGYAKLLVLDAGSSVTFDVNQATLKPEGIALLTKQAEIIKVYFPNVKMFTCGHTDSTGSYQHNLELSLARAEAVATFLREQGIPPEQLTVMGFGPDFPLESNDTAEGRAANRRTEVVLPRS